MVFKGESVHFDKFLPHGINTATVVLLLYFYYCSISHHRCYCVLYFNMSQAQVFLSIITVKTRSVLINNS